MILFGSTCSRIIKNKMLRNAIMIATCLVVGGAMTVILTLFLKKLNNIEEERWGKKPDKTTPKTGKAEKEQGNIV